jgi:hypothetical protein
MSNLAAQSLGPDLAPALRDSLAALDGSAHLVSRHELPSDAELLCVQRELAAVVRRKGGRRG